jgi:hypothetical protein
MLGVPGDNSGDHGGSARLVKVSAHGLSPARRRPPGPDRHSGNLVRDGVFSPLILKRLKITGSVA